ncbi:hypothetical protein ACO2J1_07220 [Leptospira interrogans]|nr:hypothetical protein [Leptospira interrogans]EKO68776.1 hypothetical protein LEP1GSC069_1552 [Leptospira interrogans serovar Canicola str. Fiocruz LV133]EMK23396.1 hypothetical protein LEP1GSC075_0190 [Leptospira interrogans str. Kito]EMN77868.1 hypothetical protein LEP1GSC102_1327 [Leptospira interrogans str. UI 09600]
MEFYQNNTCLDRFAHYSTNRFTYMSSPPFSLTEKVSDLFKGL